MKTPSPASSTSSGMSTHQSLQDQLRPSSLSTHCSPLTQPSLPPSMPRPLGLSPLFASERPIRLKSSKRQSTRLPDLRQSTNNDKLTTDNCELDWACSQFPLALNVTRAKSPPQSRQEEAKWWSQNGSDQSGMGRWNYWQGGSLGNPHTLSNSSSILTILRPTRTLRLCGPSPSSQDETAASTPSSRPPDALTTQQQLWKYIATVISSRSALSSLPSSTGSPMPSPPSETSLTHVDVTWSGPRSPSFYDTSRTTCPSPPPSLTSEDAVEALVNYVSMAEHLPSGGEVSLLRPGTNWADWSDVMGREMYLRRALDQLNFEYPPDSAL
jgi:hypothetical protein